MDIATEMKALAADVMRRNSYPDDMLQLVREAAAELTKAVNISGLTFSLNISTGYNEKYMHYLFIMHAASLDLKTTVFDIFIPYDIITSIFVALNSPGIYRQTECKDIKDLQDAIVQLLNSREVKRLIWSAVFLSSK